MMRRFARLAFILTIGLMCLSPGRPEAAPGTPSDVVRHFYAELLNSMKNAAALGPKGRYQKLEPVVLAAFDVPFMTKMSVGASWTRLSPDEKQRASKAFARFITATYSTQFDDYTGEKFELLDEQPVKHGSIVRTRIVQPDGEKVAINYVLHDNTAAWQIRDVYLAGTISELATRRSDFISTLRSGGIEALIARLNKKADDLMG